MPPENSNPFAVTVPTTPSAGEMTSVARATQEVQAAMVVAKRYPRDEVAVYEKIMRACKRKSLAEISAYEFQRGGSKIYGPSIHLLKAIAQVWQNIEFGWREISRKQGESVVESYAWDIENNARSALSFTVKHWRDTQSGGYALTDERDIYEACANQAARRMRACLESVIPMDIVDSAVDECEKTLRNANSEPLLDRARKMVSAFAEFGVTQKMLEAKLQHKIDAVSEHQMAQLRRIFQSLKDGISKREDWFSTAPIPEAPDFMGPPKTAQDEPQAPGAQKTAPKPKTPPAKPEPAKKATPEPSPEPETVEVGNQVESKAELAQPDASEEQGVEMANMSWEDSLKFLLKIMEKANVSEDQLVVYLREQKIAKPNQQLRDLAGSKLKDLISRWAEIAPEANAVQI